MQKGHANIEGKFDGIYNAHGGPQFLASNFHTDGGSIHFDSSHGTCGLGKIRWTGKAADEIQTTNLRRAFVNCLTFSSPLISPVEAMSCDRLIARSVHPPVTCFGAASFMVCTESGKHSWLWSLRPMRSEMANTLMYFGCPRCRWKKWPRTSPSWPILFISLDGTHWTRPANLLQCGFGWKIRLQPGAGWSFWTMWARKLLWYFVISFREETAGAGFWWLLEWRRLGTCSLLREHHPSWRCSPQG